MTQLGGQLTGGTSYQASNNIYTVLALIAMGVLLAGIVFLWVRSTQLFGTSTPFEILS